VHLDKALCVPGGLEPAHPFLPFARRRMRVLGPVVQSMFEKGHTGTRRLSMRRIVAMSIIVSEVCTQYS
jgi:hypothetical protein